MRTATTSSTSSSEPPAPAKSVTARSGPFRSRPWCGCAPASAVRKPCRDMPNSPVGMAGGFAELRTQLLSRTGVAGPARRRALARLTDGCRGELSPFSDLDLVLLHSTETPASYAGMLAERLWYPIWDSKIRLDHSVRSVGGARQIARADLPAMLGMLDLRHIAGDPDLAITLHRRVLADWRSDAQNRLEALRESCNERATRSGE